MAIVCSTRATHLVPPEGRRGFRDYPEIPVFLSDPKLGRIERDFEVYCGYWFISDKMRSILQSTDPEAFAFLRCDMRLSDGQECPVRWLCDVVRILDALDEAKSTSGIEVADDGSKVYRILGNPRLAFREEVVGKCHIFRMKYHVLEICDDDMKQHVTIGTPSLT